MDCETCSDLLLDLHYDELDAARAAEVRDHLAGCDACRAASERLGRTRVLAARFVLPDAPPTSAAVMAALSATVPAPAAVSGRVSAVLPIERARGARKGGWLQRVGELAMGRQVAMAAVFMLMVGLGLRYIPLRSPTQSVNTETTQPEVVPATDLSPPPAPSSPVAAAQSPTPTMRARAPLARPAPPAVEGRVTTRLATAEPMNTRGVGGASASPGADTANGLADRRSGNREPSNLARADELESPSPTPAAVEAPAPPPTAATSVANAQGSSYGRGPVALDEERQLQQALPAAPAPAPTNWTTARSEADGASSRGNASEAIANYRRALALNPPPAEQRSIALALYRALSSAGRNAEAAQVQAQYLTPASDPSAIAGQVSPSVPRTQTPAATAQPSAPRPTSARPARRSSSNVNNDYGQAAY